MNHFKNYLAVGLAVALTVVSGTFIKNEDNVTVGEGKGKSEKVQTMGKLARVWDATGSFLETGTGPSYGEDSEEVYTSVTIDLVSQTTNKTSMGFGDGLLTTRSVMDRTMTCSFTGTEAYYEVDATIYSDTIQYSGESWVETSLLFDMEFEMYMNAEYATIRLSQFDIKNVTESDEEDYEESDQEATVRDVVAKMLNKWLPSELFEEVMGMDILGMVNQGNQQVFETFGEYLALHEDEEVDAFKKSGSVYTLKKEYAQMLGEDLSSSILGGLPPMTVEYDEDEEEEEYSPIDLMFKADLSKVTQPVLYCTYTVDYAMEGTSIDAFDRQQYVLKNINNTVIKNEPKQKDVLTVEEFFALFETEVEED